MTSRAAPRGEPGQVWLDSAREVVDPGIRSALGLLDESNRRVASYHLGFAAADGAPADRPRGKGVRGALALLSARAAGAEAVVGAPAAVACELTHEASLLHDDIIDGDRVRRGEPTAWTVFGSASAILAGDALLTAAIEVLAAAPAAPGPVATAVRRLAGANRRLLAGQAADIAFESRAGVGLVECRAMVADKTGALLACAASLGAVLAGAPDALVAALADYGAHLGMAFQLVDDLLGIWGSPDRTGKPVASDLRSRKKSLPVVAALASESLAGRRLSEIYRTNGPLDDGLVSKAALAVEEAGGRAWASAEAERETQGALTIVAGLEIPEEARGGLVALARLLGGRDR